MQEDDDDGCSPSVAIQLNPELIAPAVDEAATSIVDFKLPPSFVSIELKNLGELSFLTFLNTFAVSETLQIKVDNGPGLVPRGETDRARRCAFTRSLPAGLKTTNEAGNSPFCSAIRPEISM